MTGFMTLYKVTVIYPSFDLMSLCIEMEALNSREPHLVG